MMNYKTEDYDWMAMKRRLAFQFIARKLGENHKITKMMGGLSHGRNDKEGNIEGHNLRSAVEEKGYLDGCFHILNLWARDNDRKAQKVLHEFYPSGYEQHK